MASARESDSQACLGCLKLGVMDRSPVCSEGSSLMAEATSRGLKP